MSPRRIFGLCVAAVLFVLSLVLSTQMIEFLDAKEVMVIQYPNGTLRVAIQPGVYGQWFGNVTTYMKRTQFWFSEKDDQGAAGDVEIPIRFNDGGHATISGSIAWEMPMDEKNLIALHVRYGSHSAIEQQLVRTVVEKSIYMTGPLMSSAESYAARRNELLNLIDDQIVRGVFKTEAIVQRVKDTMTGIEKTITVVNLVKGPDGVYLRQDESPLNEFGIKTFNLSINSVAYDATVEQQIKQQQEATMQVQTAIARAREAEQDAITVAKRGEADAAKSKWEQEVIKARAVVEAQQQKEVATLNAEMRKDVAELDKQAAERTRQQNILLGEGEAARKRLVMQADGALEKKLDAWKEVNAKYADAIAAYTGSWVPAVVMGGGDKTAGAAGVGAQQLIDLLSAKTARDLALDMSLPGQTQTRGQ